MIQVDILGKDSRLTGEIIKGSFLKQPFIAMSTRLKKIGIPFATYCRLNMSNLFVEIQDENLNVISEHSSVSATTLKDNEVRIFEFDCKLKLGKQYFIKISSDATRGNAVTAKFGKTKKETYFILGQMKIHSHELSCMIEYDDGMKYEDFVKDNVDLNYQFKNDIWKFDLSMQNNIISNKKKNKGVIYTVILNKYDDLIDHRIYSPELDYVCFTDNPNLTSNLWTIVPFETQNDDPNRTSRIPKILPHLFFYEYDYSLYVDANIVFKKKPIEYISNFCKNKPMLNVRHRDRDCILKEYLACSMQEKDDPVLMANQVYEYYKDGYPKNNGLIHAAVIYRKHNNKKIIKAMVDWWDEVSKKSRRDQLSITYVLWKNNIETNYIEQKDFCKYFLWNGSHK